MDATPETLTEGTAMRALQQVVKKIGTYSKTRPLIALPVVLEGQAEDVALFAEHQTHKRTCLLLLGTAFRNTGSSYLRLSISCNTPSHCRSHRGLHVSRDEACISRAASYRSAVVLRLVSRFSYANAAA